MDHVAHTWEAAADAGPLRLGVSSCLLGDEVRWNGGHKRDRFLTVDLAAYVEWVKVCPEVDIGLSVPRPTISLQTVGSEIRLRETASQSDLTDRMNRYAKKRTAELAKLELDGYVLKKNSPSCGLLRVPVRHESGKGASRDGTGLFAQALVASQPELPVEEEGRLHDPPIRENFVERLFAHRRLRSVLDGRWRRGDVVAFHTAHKLQLMAHAPQGYRELGRLVADVKFIAPSEFRGRYKRGFMATLAKRATPGRNTDVLKHMAGHVSKKISAPARAELAAVIDDYRVGLVPLVVPLVLLRHHARELDVEYLLQQTYLDPHPKELLLRNHV